MPDLDHRDAAREIAEGDCGGDGRERADQEAVLDHPHRILGIERAVVEHQVLDVGERGVREHDAARRESGSKYWTVKSSPCTPVASTRK